MALTKTVHLSEVFRKNIRHECDEEISKAVLANQKVVRLSVSPVLSETMYNINNDKRIPDITKK